MSLPSEELTALLPNLEPRLLRLALAMLGRVEEAEDAVQESLLRALRAWKTFRGEAKRSTWVYRIAIRVCGERLRMRRTEPEVSDFEDVESGDPSATSRDLVQVALAAIRPSQRLVIVLFHFLEVPHAQIASILGCAEGTAWSRLHAAREELRRALRKAEAAPGDTDHGS